MYPTPGTMPDFGVIDESDFEWGEAGLGDQPTHTFTQPVQLSAQMYESLP
jgi:hypothetical protein